MKKLKPWQIALLVIFYPVGIVYLIVWLIKHFTKKNNVPKIDPSKLNIVRDFHSKVVGVTFNNDNGTSRQEIIRNCKIGEDVIFKPTPTEKYPDAIGVFNTQGEQLGNLNADLAAELKRKYPLNPMSVTISNITGGGEDYNYGCNLHIIIYEQQ